MVRGEPVVMPIVLPGSRSLPKNFWLTRIAGKIWVFPWWIYFFKIPSLTGCLFMLKFSGCVNSCSSWSESLPGKSFLANRPGMKHPVLDCLLTLRISVPAGRLFCTRSACSFNQDIAWVFTEYQYGRPVVRLSGWKDPRFRKWIWLVGNHDLTKGLFTYSNM